LYSFHDAIYGFTLIDGTGTKHVLSREDPDPTLFYAAGVSAGLCGIITEVTITLEPTFCVTGTQQSSSIQPLNPDWLKGCPVNLYGPSTTGGVPGIKEYFEDPKNEYMRMVWYRISQYFVKSHCGKSLYSSIGPSLTFPQEYKSGRGDVHVQASSLP